MDRALSWRKPAVGQAGADERFLRTLADDTEDAPWMVMGDLQFWSASSFAHSLRIYARSQALPWYVASMLPIRYRREGTGRRGQLAPDCFVALVADHAREAYDLEAEGVFPAFVLEVVSPSSVQRDEQEKLRAYEVLGAREYVLFTPRAEGSSRLVGYQRGAGGVLEPNPLAADGRLWSAVLGLWLLVEGVLLVAQTAVGERLRSPEQEATARQEAEAENARLRAALARLQRDGA